MNDDETIIAPPFMSKVAASGTDNTIKPSCCRSDCRTARAVVLPAHGPPVMQIRCKFSILVFLIISSDLIDCYIMMLAVCLGAFSLSS